VSRDWTFRPRPGPLKGTGQNPTDYKGSHDPPFLHGSHSRTPALLAPGLLLSTLDRLATYRLSVRPLPIGPTDSA